MMRRFGFFQPKTRGFGSQKERKKKLFGRKKRKTVSKRPVFAFTKQNTVPKIKIFL